MWQIRVLIFRARATKDNVVCDVRFTALGGPYSGATLDKQFVYTHPTNVQEIVAHLTSHADMLKVSFDTPANLDGMVWEV